MVAVKNGKLTLHRDTRKLDDSANRSRKKFGVKLYLITLSLFQGNHNSEDGDPRNHEGELHHLHAEGDL